MLLALAARAGAETNGTAVLPSLTDANISTFNSPNLSWTPLHGDRHLLLVFLPGTGGTPHNGIRFLETAAEMGYHVVSLMYPDAVAAQEACFRSPDPQANLKFRLELLQGGNQSNLISIRPFESIESRLLREVQYLARTQPDAGWGQFFEGDSLHWSLLVAAGQSQGGGHAYIMGKIHPLARVIGFGAPKDYIRMRREPAEGFDAQSVTPIDRYYAFNHRQDTVGACTYEEQMRIFEQMGLPRFGVRNVDGDGDYGTAHLLFTNVGSRNPHGAMLMMGNRFESVYRYLLDVPAQKEEDRPGP